MLANLFENWANFANWLLMSVVVCYGSFVAYKLRVTNGEYEPFSWLN